MHPREDDRNDEIDESPVLRSRKDAGTRTTEPTGGLSMCASRAFE